jgi:menaquinone-dependent protoporphyrinogen oxidase
MKIAIIYSTSSRNTKKACKILSSKIKASIQLIPIEKAKSECLLKYNFIILAGSAYNGKVQNELKRYISRNMKTLKEKPTALVMNCEEGIDTRDRLQKTFSEELVNTSEISSNFGYELNPDEGNFIEKRRMKNKIDQYKKDGKSLPVLNMDEIDNFADYINDMIDKRVD